MTEKYIPYSVDGRSYKIPESKSAEFEKTYPSATIRMSVDDRTYNIPLEQKNEFMKTYSNATYAFDEPSDSNAEDIPAPVSVDDEPEMTRKQRRQARRDAKAEDDRTGFFESLGKGLGAGIVGATKDFTDLVNVFNTGTGTAGAAIISQGKFDEALLAEDNPLYKTSANLGDTQEKLSREADPTAGESSFWDLIKEGKLGTAMQKAVASGAESLPMMFFSKTIPGALLYGSAMAASNYIDETQENPDIPSWKRAINAAGTAALELAIERLGGPLKAKGKLTKEAITKFLNDVAKEGTETIAKRIFKGIGGVVKEGWEEGWEEVGTSFGNDILGTALDAIDGDADYGIKAQWEQLKDEDPNADAWDFAKMKGAEYMDSYIGGALSGMEISGAVKGINKGVSLMRGETRTAVQAARENGAALDYADMYDTDALVSESATALEGALVDKDGNPIVDRAFIDNISADEAYALAGREDFSSEQRKAFFDYAVAKAQSDGLNEKLDNRLNEQINLVRGRIDEATDNNGQVIVGTLDGKAVYVKGGFVTEKGTVAVGEGGVNGPVVVIDSVTGEKTTVSSDQIQRAAAHDANELFGGMESAFRDREAEQRNTARNTVSPRAKLDTVMGLQNRKMLVDLGNGLIEVEVMKVDPKTGEVMIKGKKGDLGGQAITKLGTDVFYDSLYRDENGELAFVDEIDTPTEPEDVPTDIPVAPETTAEEGPAAETPAEVTETPDYRGETYTILQNGVPVEAEVVSQDEASDTVVYRIIGENGQPMLLSSTIGEFGSAIDAAANPAPVAPEVETEPEVETAPETPADVEPEAPAAPIEPEAIDWDALFESDPEAYFVELQNQFGEEALDILNEEIEAAQNELDALAKAKTKNQNERLENRNKKKALQNRIDTLNGMVARLAPPAVPETAPEPEQPVTATETEVPVAETPTEPVEPETPTVVEPTPEPEAEQEVTPEPEEEPVPTEVPEDIPEAPATNIPFQIPEQQKGNAIGRLVAEIRQKIDKLVAKAGAKDFISTDTSRPAMTGIYHSGGFEYATDSHILVKIKANYPAEQEGKIISPKTGLEITGKFPNADKVIKGAYEDARPVEANLDDIIAYAQAAEEIKKGLKKDTKINIGVGNKVFDSAKLLVAAKMAKKHGLTSILTKDKHYSAMMFSGKDGEIMIMPITNPSSGIIQISDGRSVFGQTQSYRIKTPETLKGIEATRTALEAILPNLEQAEIDYLKKHGVVKLDNGKVIYVFETADIAKNKDKAKDPNTYNALDEIEKHGLEIPLSKEEISVLFPESVNSPKNSVPLENEPNGKENGGKEDAPEGDDTNGPATGYTGGGADNGGSKEGDSGNPKAKPSQGKGDSEGGKESGKVKNQYPARKGNVTGKTLIDTFGLAAVEIPDSRKPILNSFYDFMMEMAKTLGISPKSIGNGGWLTLGNLRANATPFARHSIAYGTFTGDVLEQHLLLKYSRVSSIAHEWWHSLDHALGFFESGKSKGPTTGMAPSAFDGRQETFDAVSAVMKAIQDSGYTARIQSLNYTQSFKNYVLEPTESAARAFAEYIRNKFDEQGIAITGVNDFYDDTQPTAEEMKLITPAIENLFNVLQEKEGKKPGTSILYQIGEDVDKKVATSSETSEVARRLANEAIDMMFEQAGREVVFVTDEQAEQMRRLAGANAEFMIASDKPVFVSNAAVAVMGIKQEKATPEQWLKMIENAGGLKAGEDKWMGLSDWLKESDKNTLTKQEVLDYIVEHMIQIEEVHYAEAANRRGLVAQAEEQMLERFQHEFNEYVVESEETTGSLYMADHYQYAYNKMLDIYGDDFGLAFGHEDGMLEINDTDAASAVSGIPVPDIRVINRVRENYTTGGLENKREIAFVVPTVEAFDDDEIHFVDAGDGRAIVWVRFGETYTNEEAKAEYEQARKEEEAFRVEMEQKYGSLAGGMRSILTEEEYANYMELIKREMDLNSELTRSKKGKKILVIDEIQSNRHQAARVEKADGKKDENGKKERVGYRVSEKKAKDDYMRFMARMHKKYDMDSSTPFAEVLNKEELEERERLDRAWSRAIFGIGVPAAPFENNWHELAMKRMLRYAAEHGYDAVAWTKGEQQAERYGIAKVVKDIYVAPSDVERYVSIKTISGDAIEIPTEPNSDVIVSGEYKGQRLSDVVGKELADKILSVPEGTDDYISGDDLKVGGEGMKGFYDKMLPAFMNKYGKKWGIKVADITLPNVEEAGRVMHSVPVTDAMKESVMEGQVMFMKRPNGKVFGWTDGKKIYLTKDGLNPNTKIHEYTHLWAQAMMQKNPKGWQSVKDLLRGTPVWNEVLNDPNYSNIHADEDLVASEVLSRISGRDGSAKLERMAQQMVDEAKGSMRKLEARGLIQRIKDALNEFWNWVGTELFGIEKFESVEQITDRVLWDLMNATDLGELSEGQVETQIVTDPKVIAELEASPKRTGYRNVVMNEDGTFSSPMAYWLQSTKGGAKTRVETAKFELGKWEEAEEHPELVDENGHVTLVKPNKSTVEVAYDPYIHNRLDPVNLQFKDAWKREELVYVETVVPETDLESGYHAEGALLPVGVHSWSNGDLILSKYDKPVRIMPWEDVADAWVERLNGEGVHFDVVPPALRPLLVERGVEILPPHKGMGKDCFAAYEAWKDSISSDNDGLLFRSSDSPITPEMDDIRYRFVGEQGARNIDDSTRSTRMLDNLAQARRMEEYGMDAKTIKHSTGWERGADGKWRYETPDYITLKEDVIEQMFNNVEHNIRMKKNNKYGDWKPTSVLLPELIDAPELFRAYPELKKLRVHFSESGLFGVSHGGAITIHYGALAPSTKQFGRKSLLGTLVHEIQHEIQRIEGFSLGAYHKTESASAYQRDAGEVEARNVEYRMSLSPAERAMRLAEDTEDVAREDQIIIEKGIPLASTTYADIQNAAAKFLVGEERERLLKRAVNEEAKKLNVLVTYKQRWEMPKGHQNDKGYYDPKTGEVVVCTENATSIADAIQTILHEAVAHKGLRQLMGDKFNEFINRVYESLDAETKAKVDALAESQYNGNKAVAMEEYMATLAESTDFKNDTLWDKIKSIFEDIINAILGRNDIKIGDNELRYILRASYNNMVNPRGIETMRGWAQDQMMRDEYKINEATPDILSRTGIDPSVTATEAAKAVYDKVVSDTWQEMQRQFQDAYQPVRIAIDAIQQETGNIPIEDYENYLLIQNQSSSRSRVEIDEFAERYYSPIVEQVNNIIDKIMEDRGWKVNDADRRAEVYGELRQYLIAKHGLERNEYYQTHKMRNLTAAEKRKEYALAKQAYDTEVADINADTSLTDAERELKLRDAKDAYDAAILEINTREVPDIRDYSGLTSLFGLEPKKFRQAEAEARNLVDNAENMFGPELDILWERINKATDKTLRHSYESGIISRQQYNDIKDMFEFYIPLRGFEDITAEDIYSYARFEGNRFSAAVQTAKGRTSVANDPLAYIMSMAESEITQGNKNRAKQALYNYLLNRTQTDADGNQIQNSLMQVESVWYVKSVDATGNTVMTMAAPDHASGETYEEFEARMEALAATGDAAKSKKGKIDIGMRFQKPANMGAHYVHLKVNGVDKAIYINGDPKAADAINGTFKKERNELSEAMGKWNRFLSSMFTNYSLEFTVRNYFRDMLYSHINIGVKESNPAYRKKFRQNWRHNNFGSIVKMLKAFRAGEFEGRSLTEDEAAFVEFMKNGGQTGYVILNKVETHRADLEKAIERMQKGLAKGGVKDSTVFKYTLGGIELLNEASELVTRFAAFKTSRDMGRSVVQSISDAKEVTVNFNTKGAQDGKGFMGMIAHYFGWSKYFFNASVQGVQNLKAMASANKLKFGGVVGGIVATGFLMPLITGAIAQLLGGDEEEYWNIPEYDRQNNFCIPVGNGKYAKIPLPIGFREMYAIGDMVSAMMFDKKFARDVQSVGTDMANKLATIILPINPLEGSANGLSIWHTLAYTAAPSSAQFLIQNLTNTDWKGAPLQKEYTYNENDPQWMKAFAGNPDWMKLLSKWCNEHINADGDYKGWDWSPEKLDNTLSNLFGGVYTLIKKTGKSISMIWNEENRNMQNAPVAGVFIGSGIDSDDRFVTDAYYEMMDYYDSQVGYIKRRAARFGYDLDEVFNKEKGKHHPKMNEIYSNKNFDFMQEWYKGNNKLEKLNDKIKNLEKKIAGKENPTQSDLNKLARLKDQLAVERREFVDDMLELD